MFIKTTKPELEDSKSTLGPENNGAGQENDESQGQVLAAEKQPIIHGQPEAQNTVTSTAEKQTQLQNTSESRAEKQTLYCSFCGKSQYEVRKLIAGPTVFICDECVDLCSDIVRKESKDALLKAREGIPAPAAIQKILSEYVVGQDHAKTVLSVAVHNHYKRLNHRTEQHDVELAKCNILLIGPTGSGKTLLAQTLARILDVPFVMADATTLTEAGYVGMDVEQLLHKLLRAADFNIERAQRGIVYIDAIDMISRKSESPTLSRAVSGEGVQQALLKLIEGTVASVPPQGGRKHPQDFLEIDTGNILFICGGAFVGLEKITSTSDVSKPQVEPAEDPSDDENRDRKPFRKPRPRDLMKFGLIPELAARLPVVAILDDPDEPALKLILTQPKNALLKQYKRLFELESVDLMITDDALTAIARKAIDEGTGAWGLRAIVESVLLETMFHVPTLKGVTGIMISKDVIEGTARARYVYGERGTAGG